MLQSIQEWLSGASLLVETLSSNIYGIPWDLQQLPWSVSSECAFKQAVTSTTGGTHLLGPKPLHHVAGVPTMPAGQAEIGRSAYGHVADGTLEREAFADGTLRATDLVPAVATVHTKLNPFMRIRRRGGKLQHLSSFLSQTPAVEDFSIAFLKVIKLLGIGGVQKPFIFIMLITFSLTGITVGKTPKADFFWRRLSPR